MFSIFYMNTITEANAVPPTKRNEAKIGSDIKPLNNSNVWDSTV